MKCNTCNGLGRTKATEFIGVDEGLREVVILCPTCGGKGFVDMTNEKWFCELPTKEKAEVISRLSYYHGNIYEIEKWLNQPHTNKE